MSLGHAPITMPNVANGDYDVPQAQSVLRNDGFTIGTVYGPTGGTIYTTDPAPGATVPYGTPVTIYLH